MSLTVSVVIPTRDDAEALTACLAALSRQTLAPWEVVVVDNGSSDRGAAIAAAWGARVVSELRVGIPSAAAAGYDAAKGDVIARLDADSLPDAWWVERITARMTADPDLVALTGTGRFVDLPAWCRAVVSAAYLGAYYLLTYLALGHAPLWGSSMAVRRDAWLAVREEVSLDDVHDDLDLAFALGPHRRIRFDRTLAVGVSARSLRGRAQRRRRLDRAWRTLRVNWRRTPPWRRWWSRVRGLPAV